MMVYVRDCIIEVKNEIARVRSESAMYCPDCGMKLFFHGTCKRKVRAQEQTRCYVLRVLFCKSCKRKIVLMHYPIFCYNGQFRRGADGTPLTYMLHGHIHKTEDQVLVDRFCAETRAMMRKSAHQETAQPVPCQMINCFCMYSDYMPLTLEEWVECDQRRRAFLCAGSDYKEFRFKRNQSENLS